MAYCFTPKDRSGTKALRRIARECLAGSADLLAADRMARPELVHELRKNVKKTRALLRLVRPGFDAFAKENAALRDAGRMISALRDADVLAATFEAVAARVWLPPDVLEAVRARVITRAPAIADPDGLLAAHAEAIARIDARARKWKLDADGFDAIEAGLERSWADAQKAMRAARAAPSGAALHRWRKRVKDHWYHARLLQPIWPQMMAPHIAAAETLGEMLGDARDLAFLVARLDDIADAAGVRTAARDAEARLLADAFPLGELFFSEPSGGLSRRWRGWWEIWRRE